MTLVPQLYTCGYLIEWLSHQSVQLLCSESDIHMHDFEHSKTQFEFLSSRYFCRQICQIHLHRYKSTQFVPFGAHLSFVFLLAGLKHKFSTYLQKWQNAYNNLFQRALNLAKWINLHYSLSPLKIFSSSFEMLTGDIIWWWALVENME